MKKRFLSALLTLCLILSMLSMTAQAEGTGETFNIPVTINWDDSSDSDGIRPESMTLKLVQNGTTVRTETVTGTGNRWTYTFEDVVAKNPADDSEYLYTLHWDLPSKYNVSCSGNAASGWTLTLEPETVSISVRVIWDDNNNAAGKRLDGHLH